MTNPFEPKRISVSLPKDLLGNIKNYVFKIDSNTNALINRLLELLIDGKLYMVNDGKGPDKGQFENIGPQGVSPFLINRKMK